MHRIVGLILIWGGVLVSKSHFLSYASNVDLDEIFNLFGLSFHMDEKNPTVSAMPVSQSTDPRKQCIWVKYYYLCVMNISLISKTMPDLRQVYQATSA